MTPTRNPDGSLSVPAAMYDPLDTIQGDGEAVLRPGDPMYDSWSEWIAVRDQHAPGSTQ